MSSRIYKTNINCAACILKVHEALDVLAGPENWEVNIMDINKPLEFKIKDFTLAEINSVLEPLGYWAKPLPDEEI